MASEITTESGMAEYWVWSGDRLLKKLPIEDNDKGLSFGYEGDQTIVVTRIEVAVPGFDQTVRRKCSLTLSRGQSLNFSAPHIV